MLLQAILGNKSDEIPLLLYI